MKTLLVFLVVILAVLSMYFSARRLAKVRRGIIVVAAVAALVGYSVFLFAKPNSWMIGDVVVLVVAAVVGSGLGLLITTRPSVISFCVAAGIVDVLSVTGGITRKLSDAYRDGSSVLLQYLAISIPSSGDVRPIIGIGDLVVVCSLYFALSRLGYRGFNLFLAPLSGLLIALVFGLLVGGVFAIPFFAVTTIAFVWIAPNPVSDDAVNPA